MKPRIHKGIHGCCSVSPREICAPVATENSGPISALIPPGLAPDIRRSADCYCLVTRGSSADGSVHTDGWHRNAGRQIAHSYGKAGEKPVPEIFAIAGSITRKSAIRMSVCRTMGRTSRESMDNRFGGHEQWRRPVA